jgi:hypothetical protein
MLSKKELPALKSAATVLTRSAASALRLAGTSNVATSASRLTIKRTAFERATFRHLDCSPITERTPRIPTGEGQVP